MKCNLFVTDDERRKKYENGRDAHLHVPTIVVPTGKNSGHIINALDDETEPIE